VPLSALRKVAWQDNPACRYDDDLWLGYLLARSGVVGVSVPGVHHSTIWSLQVEKVLFGRALSRSINQDGSNRSKCTRSLVEYP